MRRLKLISLTLVALAVLSVVTNYVVEVFRARLATPDIVQAALQSEGILVPLSDLSPRQLDILLAVEDPAFYGHPGWDLSTPGAGMTTITQALVKIHYFDQFRQGLPKIRQTLIARFALDPLTPKEDQLLLFINEAYLGDVDGREVVGFEEAAHAYFGKPFSQMTEEEYVRLVAMLAAPGTYNVRHRPKANAERVRRIRRLLANECVPDGWMDWELVGCE